MALLEGKVAIVTGCARERGLGRGIALALARAGADVGVTDIRPTGTRNRAELEHEGREWRGLDSVVEELSDLGRRAIGLLGDVGVKADADRMILEALDYFGQIDILVNNAAAPQGADRAWTWEIPEEAFDEQIRVNTKGAFLMSGPVVAHMLARGAQGRIVNIASTAGKQGNARTSAYSASKFALIGLTQSLARELAPRGITVNAVCPGAMDTAREAARKSRMAGLASDAKLPAWIPPVGRLGAAEDIGRAVLFLVDPAASFITGQSINVDGGLIM